MGTVGTLHVAKCEFTMLIFLPKFNECKDKNDNYITHLMKKDLRQPHEDRIALWSGRHDCMKTGS